MYHRRAKHRRYRERAQSLGGQDVLEDAVSQRLCFSWLRKTMGIHRDGHLDLLVFLLPVPRKLEPKVANLGFTIKTLRLAGDFKGFCPQLLR